MTKLKIAGFVLAVLVAMGVGYKLAPSPAAETKTVFVDKVQYVDRVVTKDVIRTVTKPDGTKIVTESKARETVKTLEKDKTVSLSAPAPPLPRYSVGVNVQPKHLYPFEGVYGAELGVRIGNSPIWGTVEIRSNKDWSLGARWEF